MKFNRNLQGIYVRCHNLGTNTKALIMQMFLDAGFFPTLNLNPKNYMLRYGYDVAYIGVSQDGNHVKCYTALSKQLDKKAINFDDFLGVINETV